MVSMLFYIALKVKNEISFYEDEIIIYFGSGKLVQKWTDIPILIKTFYEHSHNVFYYFESRDIRLIPLKIPCVTNSGRRTING
ncbi:hypothetical protein JOD45_000637 [Scopulibacillus daqui]|uniref:Uncharacterized protein n=1 Tax=Scopulibacillus daqui TaxID=1469162 RepID=A0ABS2PWL4_9BACL|nr:hypothetical protein [Scopulibacillus daqui]